MFETLREFTKQTPVLASLLERELLNDPGHFNNTEDLRYHVEKLHQSLMAKLKGERRLYAVLHFPEQELSCPICKETYFGYYWELNNPATGKGIVVANRLIHGLVYHEQLFLDESMQTVSGTRVGESRLILDLAGLVGVFKGADVPAEVTAELAEAQAVQQQQLAAAGEVVASGGH